ncbi:unnamed protein product [Amoebophrya sp. A25]|nr:unnamed protein product [Amoebophrya sp. A25]|eukprot:GSA25T00011554001.1
MITGMGVAASRFMGPAAARDVCAPIVPQGVSDPLITMGPLLGAILAKQVLQPRFYAHIERARQRENRKQDHGHGDDRNLASQSSSARAGHAAARGHQAGCSSTSHQDGPRNGSTTHGSSTASTRSRATDRRPRKGITAGRERTLLMALPQFLMFLCTQMFLHGVPALLPASEHRQRTDVEMATAIGGARAPGGIRSEQDKILDEASVTESEGPSSNMMQKRPGATIVEDALRDLPLAADDIKHNKAGFTSSGAFTASRLQQVIETLVDNNDEGVDDMVNRMSNLHLAEQDLSSVVEDSSKAQVLSNRKKRKLYFRNVVMAELIKPGNGKIRKGELGLIADDDAPLTRLMQDILDLMQHQTDYAGAEPVARTRATLATTAPTPTPSTSFRPSSYIKNILRSRRSLWRIAATTEQGADLLPSHQRFGVEDEDAIREDVDTVHRAGASANDSLSPDVDIEDLIDDEDELDDEDDELMGIAPLEQVLQDVIGGTSSAFSRLKKLQSELLELRTSTSGSQSEHAEQHRHHDHHDHTPNEKANIATATSSNTKIFSSRNPKNTLEGGHQNKKVESSSKLKEVARQVATLTLLLLMQSSVGVLFVLAVPATQQKAKSLALLSQGDMLTKFVVGPFLATQLSTALMKGSPLLLSSSSTFMIKIFSSLLDGGSSSDRGLGGLSEAAATRATVSAFSYFYLASAAMNMASVLCCRQLLPPDSGKSEDTATRRTPLTEDRTAARTPSSAGAQQEQEGATQRT